MNLEYHNFKMLCDAFNTAMSRSYSLDAESLKKRRMFNSIKDAPLLSSHFVLLTYAILVPNGRKTPKGFEADVVAVNLFSEKRCKIGTIVLGANFNILSNFKKGKNVIDVNKPSEVRDVVYLKRLTHSIFIKEYFGTSSESIGEYSLGRDIRKFREVSGLKENADKLSKTPLTEDICNKLVDNFIMRK